MKDLKALALAAKKYDFNSHRRIDFERAASPDVVLGLITKAEVLSCALLDSDNQRIADEALMREVVERWDTPLWKDVPATAVVIGKLRERLEQK